MKGAELARIKVSQTIEEIPSEAWGKVEPADFPFASWSFLRALEISRSVGERTGWLPFYLTAWDDSTAGDSTAGDSTASESTASKSTSTGSPQLIGAMILFAKTNSYGEYIFDWAWANAYAQYGLDYYPKFVSAIPFTPATGPKILLQSGVGAPAEIRGADLKRASTSGAGIHLKENSISSQLIKASQVLIQQTGASSTHSLFITDSERAFYEEAGFFLRHSFQFHWRNNNYVSFENFLSALTSKRRKEILRERRQVEKANVTIERLTGQQLTEDHADIMYQFYLSTIDKMGGQDYLTHDFYREVFKALSDKILFVLARDKTTGRPVAGALNYLGVETLYGRNWGCLSEYKSLHFELCYYQGIEYAIEKGFTLFEAGAQGEHKLSRGFLPSLTYSAHKIEQPQMDKAIQNFVEREKDEIAKVFEVYKEHSPFSVTLK